ncbi:MAG TPA: GreA/GreB family elongation factor [Longimicrobiales bacterium]|nr:GreA/GreB family elongation factor [Longimicrobiales bacterium]
MGDDRGMAKGPTMLDGGETAQAATTLREEVGEALERLSRMLLERTAGRGVDGAGRTDDPETERLKQAVSFLGQVAAGWSQVPEVAIPAEGAGFGSTVVVQDVEGGQEETYTLMTGALLDIDAGQVSLGSPIGQALLGARAGDVVTVSTPQRTRRLRVLSVLTLRDRLEREVP